MIQKKMFGVENDDSLLRTLFLNDWQHTVFIHKGQKYGEMGNISGTAKAIIFSSLLVSFGTVAYG